MEYHLAAFFTICNATSFFFFLSLFYLLILGIIFKLQLISQSCFSIILYFFLQQVNYLRALFSCFFN